MEIFATQLKETKKVTGNGERILALLRENRNKYLKQLKEEEKNLNIKDEEIAVGFREEGNKLYKNYEFLEAINMYNSSLCYSKSNSTNISIAFANRSAVYFELGYYETCLKDIQLALDHGYPEEKKQKLIKRIRKCEEKIKNQTDSHDEYLEPEIKLSYKVNEKIPFMVEGIELFEDEVHGRGLRATKDFKVGDILIKEDPFVKIVDLDYTYTHCFWCVKSCLMNLMPCDESVLAMFCSKNCYEENLQNGLKIEAKVFDTLNSLHKDHVLVIRSIVKFLSVFENIDDLEDFFDSCVSQKITAFDINYNDPNVVEKQKMKAFLSLASNSNHLTDQKYEIFEKIAQLYYLTVECTELNEKFSTDKQRIAIMNMMHQLYGIKITNSFGLGSLDPKLRPRDPQYLYCSGFNICLLSSLINHCCAPNLYGLGDNVKASIVQRPIKVGEQLSINYVKCHLAAALVDRRNELKKKYFFDCSCVACENNYPTWQQLLSSPNIPQSLVQKIVTLDEIDFCSSKAMKKVKKVFNRCNNLMQKHDRHYPCWQLLRAQQYQQKCIHLLFYHVPLQHFISKNSRTPILRKLK